MRKILLTLAAGAAVLAAMPAAAAPGDWNRGPGPRPGPVMSPPIVDASRQIDARRAQINQRIEFGARRGALTRREVQNLRFKMNEVAYLERQYLRSNNFMSVQEASVLNRKMDYIEQTLRYAMRDDDRRGGPRRGW